MRFTASKTLCWSLSWKIVIDMISEISRCLQISRKTLNPSFFSSLSSIKSRLFWLSCVNLLLQLWLKMNKKRKKKKLQFHRSMKRIRLMTKRRELKLLCSPRRGGEQPVKPEMKVQLKLTIWQTVTLDSKRFRRHLRNNVRLFRISKIKLFPPKKNLRLRLWRNSTKFQPTTAFLNTSHTK